MTPLQYVIFCVTYLVVRYFYIKHTGVRGSPSLRSSPRPEELR